MYIYALQSKWTPNIGKSRSSKASLFRIIGRPKERCSASTSLKSYEIFTSVTLEKDPREGQFWKHICTSHSTEKISKNSTIWGLIRPVKVIFVKSDLERHS